jgi:quercetin dioxygenase-like cupin family protein
VAVVLTLGSVPLAVATRDSAGFVRIQPNQIVWRDEPGYGGLQMAVIEGDPAKPGVYVVRVRFPPGVMTRPHRHPEDRLATVISGTWYTGTGTTFDPDRTVALSPGSFMKHPANAYHFDGAKSETVIVQIVGVGPSDTVFFHPDDGPVGVSNRAP